MDIASWPCQPVSATGSGHVVAAADRIHIFIMIILLARPSGGGGGGDGNSWVPSTRRPCGAAPLSRRLDRSAAVQPKPRQPVRENRRRRVPLGRRCAKRLSLSSGGFDSRRHTRVPRHPSRQRFGHGLPHSPPGAHGPPPPPPPPNPTDGGTRAPRTRTGGGGGVSGGPLLHSPRTLVVPSWRAGGGRRAPPCVCAYVPYT